MHLPHVNVSCKHGIRKVLERSDLPTVHCISIYYKLAADLLEVVPSVYSVMDFSERFCNLI